MKQVLRLMMAAGALGLAATPAMAAAHLGAPVTVGMQLEPPMLDPTGNTAAAIDQITYHNVFEGLARFDSDGAIVPGLAESWDVTEDGLTYTFHLRSGVKFHDGTDFEATDVVFSYDRARGEQSSNPQKVRFASIASVEAVDPLTVKIVLSEPTGNFLFNMAWGEAAIVAPESADTNATNPVGTGPFKFSRWVKGDRVEFVANPDYWGEGAKISGVTFKFISDPTAAFAAVMSEDVDVYPVFPAPENLAQFEADPRFKVVVGSTEGETILAMNNKKAPLDDVRVREAIAHAIDRQAIIDGAMFGYGTPIGTHFAPHNPAYVDLTAQSAYDPEKAKALLAEAGHADDITLSLKLPPPTYARRGGEIIAAQLRAVGIQTEITNVEWAQWLEGVFKGKDFDLTIVSHIEPLDLEIYADENYYFQYGKPEYKAIIAELNRTADPARRTELIQQAEHMIADDYVNAYLFQLAQTGVAKVKLMGLWENAPTPAFDMTGAYWE